MILELTPETYFENISVEGPLHVVMHYGATCGPCKRTIPIYDAVETHFVQHKVTNVKFYWFHQWQPEYKQFIEENKLKVDGVPTFKYFYFGELLTQRTQSFDDADVLKQSIIEVIRLIESQFGEFNLYES